MFLPLRKLSVRGQQTFVRQSFDPGDGEENRQRSLREFPFGCLQRAGIGIPLWCLRGKLPAVPQFLTQSCCLSALSPAEYAENIGDGKNQEFRESEQKRILDLLENF